MIAPSHEASSFNNFAAFWATRSPYSLIGTDASVPGWRNDGEAGLDAGTLGRIFRSFRSRPCDEGADHGQGWTKYAASGGWVSSASSGGAVVDRAQIEACFGCYQVNVRDHGYAFTGFAL
jgi:hypothetical protein